MEQTPYESVREVMGNLERYLPALLAGLLVLAIGAIAAWVVAKLSVRILIFLRLDRVAGRFGWGRALEKGDVRHSLFGLAGTALGVLLFLVFLENALVIWKLTVLSQLLEKLVSLVPQLLSAAGILLVGWGVAAAGARLVHRALVQEGFERARLAGRMVFAALVVLASAIALVELEIAVTIVTGAFLMGFGAVALGCVLAFGLGSRRAVEMMWEEKFRRRRKEREGKSDDAEPKPPSSKGELE